MIDEAFIEKVCFLRLLVENDLADEGCMRVQYKIDYVAHDVDPYGSAGHDDVYAFAKMQGEHTLLPFSPTPFLSPPPISSF